MRSYRSGRLPILLLCLIFLWSGQGKAQEEAIQELTAPDLKKMLDNRAVTLVNVLSGIEYDVQHIPGSINIPIIFMHTTEKLPSDKGAPLVFHCLSDR